MTEHDGPTPGDQESLAWAEREIKRLRGALTSARRHLESGPVAVPSIEEALDVIDDALGERAT